jgi:ORF6N domain
VQLIERRIYLIRSQKVMIDEDLAELYGVPTHRLNEQVKRNRKHFPQDFMFQLTQVETESLRSQIAISKSGRGVGALCHMSSLSKALRCCRVF